MSQIAIHNGHVEAQGVKIARDPGTAVNGTAIGENYLAVGEARHASLRAAGPAHGVQIHFRGDASPGRNFYTLDRGRFAWRVRRHRAPVNR